MTARLDVPALLRRAGKALTEVCLQGAEPPAPVEVCESDAAYLARLADAVEAWQAARSRQSHDDILAVRRSELAMLALLRGEVEP